MIPVTTTDAPAAIGPYRQAVIHGGLVYCSGQIGLSVDGQLVGGDVANQARQVFRNLAAVLAAAGSGPERVLKTTVFLRDMADFAAMNAVYADFFGDARPARSTVAAAGLPRDVLVEIDCIAALPDAG